jgi:hypothetical protein
MTKRARRDPAGSDSSRTQRRPSRPPAGPARLLALQRAAGNRATRRLVQRELEITDQGRLFTDQTLAATYLTQQYTAARGALGLAELQRLNEVAAAASSPNEVNRITLADALDYIQTAKPLRVQRDYRDPSLSPVRAPDPPWRYQFAPWSPGPLEAPQSPQYRFPDEPHPQQSIDFAAHLGEQQTLLSGERASRKDEKLGKNLFQYSVKAQIRITHLAEGKDVGGQPLFSPAKPPEHRESSAQSRTYQSRFQLLGEKPGEPERDYEPEIRQELDRIYEGAKDMKEFREKSTLYAHERDAEKRDRSGGYFADPTRSKPNAISTMFVHSEVQAAADAHVVAGHKLAQRLLRDIIREARSEQTGTEPIDVVVLAVYWVGFSDPNTVCSNACKGALRHISQVLEQKFTSLRHTEKISLKDDNIFVRGSAQLSLSGHVQGEKEFQGMGVGASGAMKSTRTQHRTVTEYKPKK